jgi:hypothetical protein
MHEIADFTWILRGRSLTAAAIALPAQQQQQKSAYDPGLRPVTSESIHAEKAAEDAWFSRL